VGMAPVDGGCTSDRAFSLQLVLKYLDIPTASEAENGNVTIGSRELPVLGHHFGGYRSTAAQENLRGFQVMLNYRHALQVAPQVSWEDLTNDRVPPSAIAGKIAIVGYVGGDPHDTWRSLGKVSQLPGVVVHAQMTSNLLSYLLDDRALITTWSDPLEFGWMLLWGSASGAIWFKLRGTRMWLVQVGTMVIAIAACEVYLSTRSVWLPLIPTVLVVVATPLVARGVDRHLNRQYPD
jgi:CHASE2 domain-containing sensor protein